LEKAASLFSINQQQINPSSIFLKRSGMENSKSLQPWSECHQEKEYGSDAGGEVIDKRPV
jgi:hypothetical protein